MNGYQWTRRPDTAYSTRDGDTIGWVREKRNKKTGEIRYFASIPYGGGEHRVPHTTVEKAVDVLRALAEGRLHRSVSPDEAVRAYSGEHPPRPRSSGHLK